MPSGIVTGADWHKIIKLTKGRETTLDLFFVP